MAKLSIFRDGEVESVESLALPIPERGLTPSDNFREEVRKFYRILMNVFKDNCLYTDRAGSPLVVLDVEEKEWLRNRWFLVQEDKPGAFLTAIKNRAECLVGFTCLGLDCEDCNSPKCTNSTPRISVRIVPDNTLRYDQPEREFTAPFSFQPSQQASV
jgi:hypothetical protein